MHDKDSVLIVFILLSMFLLVSISNCETIEVSGWVPEKISSNKNTGLKHLDTIRFFTEWDLTGKSPEFIYGRTGLEEIDETCQKTMTLKLHTGTVNRIENEKLKKFINRIIEYILSVNPEIERFEFNIENKQGENAIPDLKKLKLLSTVIEKGTGKKPGLVVSPDWIRVWDGEIWEDLDTQFDYFILMLYDYNKHSKLPAGPAPYNLVKNDVERFLENVGKPEKVILGIPNYGFVWKRNDVTDYEYQGSLWLDTTDTDYYIPSLSVKDYIFNWEKREGYFKNTSVPGVPRTMVIWDPEQKNFYMAVERDNKAYIVYFEDVVSLITRVELVEEYRLKGICFWKAGREDELIYNYLAVKKMFKLSPGHPGYLMLTTYFRIKSYPSVNGRFIKGNSLSPMETVHWKNWTKTLK